ncbi:MAG: 50S ribosomal protein L29 [Chloroflexi bacterium]|nr:MAG: 50S ribosomal protein L29 [Chloroflexota bacterium]TME15814.1 MAG: 50S ribosomal protein L29 [Chloroflexota bacterium]
MKAEELTELDAEELASRLRDSRRELYELRFKLAVGQLDDHRQIRKVRHDIARILTSIRQRDLGLAAEPAVVEPAAEPAAAEPAKAKAPSRRKAAVAVAEPEPEPEPGEDVAQEPLAEEAAEDGEEEAR